MAGPYQRLSNGQSADSGAQAITTVVNAVEAGLEDAEATIAAQAALIAGKADTHSHPYDATGSAAAAQAAAVQRANHTGTQLASTISNFDTQVRTNRLDQLAAPTTAVGMGSQRLTGLGAPSASTDAATKGYADSLVGGGPTGPILNVRNFGIIDDTQDVSVSVTSSSNVVTFSSAVLTSTAVDAGKKVWIPGAGASGGWLSATIVTVTNSTTAVLSASSSVTASGRGALFGTDNTAAIDTLFDNNPRSIFYFPGDGVGRYYTDGDHAVPLSSTVQGDDFQLTRFVTSHLTNSIFVLDALYPRVRDISIQHGSLLYRTAGTMPTAGAGVRVHNTADASSGNWVGAVIERINVSQMYNGIECYRGTGVDMLDCWAYNCGYAGIVLRNVVDVDFGSFRVHRALIGSDGVNGWTLFGILWLGGGGTWITDCHMNRVLYGVCLWQGGDGNKSYSTNIQIHNNSFEDYFDYGVGEPATTLGLGAGIKWYWGSVGRTISSVSITGNTINSVLASGTPIDIVKTSGNGAGPTGTSIMANVTNTGSGIAGITGGGAVHSSVKLIGNSPNGAISGATVVG